MCPGQLDKTTSGRLDGDRGGITGHGTATVLYLLPVPSPRPSSYARAQCATSGPQRVASAKSLAVRPVTPSASLARGLSTRFISHRSRQQLVWGVPAHHHRCSPFTFLGNDESDPYTLTYRTRTLREFTEKDNL